MDHKKIGKIQIALGTIFLIVSTSLFIINYSWGTSRAFHDAALLGDLSEKEHSIFVPVFLNDVNRWAFLFVVLNILFLVIMLALSSILILNGWSDLKRRR